MPRREYSHSVADVHMVAREALGYLLGDRAMALAVSLMFASSCMVFLSFGGGGEDDKGGLLRLPNEIIIELESR